MTQGTVAGQGPEAEQKSLSLLTWSADTYGPPALGHTHPCSAQAMQGQIIQVVLTASN